MAGKKTGVFLNPVSEEIVNRTAEKFGYTKISNTINFVISEYDRLSNVANATEEKSFKEPEKKKIDVSHWFVIDEEDNNEGKGTNLCL